MTTAAYAATWTPDSLHGSRCVVASTIPLTLTRDGPTNGGRSRRLSGLSPSSYLSEGGGGIIAGQSGNNVTLDLLNPHGRTDVRRARDD
jgi:hypothetical protein